MNKHDYEKTIEFVQVARRFKRLNIWLLTEVVCHLYPDKTLEQIMDDVTEASFPKRKKEES